MRKGQGTMLTRRGEWAPDHAIEYPPVFVWPPRPKAVAALVRRFARLPAAVQRPVHGGGDPRVDVRHSVGRDDVDVGSRMGRLHPGAQRGAARACGTAPSTSGSTFASARARASSTTRSGRDRGDRFTFGEPDPRERVLVAGERPADLDGVGGRDAVAVRQRPHPVGRPRRSPRLVRGADAAGPALDRGPLLRRAPADPLAAAVQGGAQPAPSQHQPGAVVGVVDAPGRAPPVLQLDRTCSGSCRRIRCTPCSARSTG